MSLNDVISLTISASSNTPTREGFGVPLLAVSKVPATWGAARVRSFSTLTEMTDAGFLVTDPAYLMATKLCSQNPRPATWKIGKKAVASSQSIQLLVTDATEGLVYTITVGTSVITRTVPAASSTSAEATAIAALIDALAGAVASAATATITVTPATTGALLDFSAWSSALRLTDATADPGIATDLAAFLAETSDWYGLALDNNSKAEVVAAAAWVEANKKLFITNTSDYGNKDAGSTTDTAYTLKAASYKRTACLFSGAQLLSYSGLAWMAEEFPYDPGKRTWAFKALAGVTVDVLTSGWESALKAKNCTFYAAILGVACTQGGKSAQGEWIDTMRFIDWFESEMKLQVFNVIVNSPKIPYTDKGAGTIYSTMSAVMRSGVRAGGLVDDSNLAVVVPKVADVDAVSKAGRLLPDITFSGTLDGAIHSVKIAGTLTV